MCDSVLLQDINLNSIEYGTLDIDQENNTFNSKISYKDENLILRFPPMCLKDISLSSLRVEFLDYQNTEYKALRSIEKSTVSHFTKNSKKVFGFAISEESLINMLSSFVVLPENLPSLPQLEIQFSGDIKLEDKDGDEITLASLQKDNLVVLDVQLDRVEFHKQYFRIVGSVLGLKIKEYYQSIDYDFNDSDEYMTEESETTCANSVDLMTV